jgi:small conductance mechanosensitive channel
MFQTRSQSWREVGLARQLSRKAVKRARIQGFLLLLALAGILVAYSYRRELFGVDMPARVATVVALLILGWQFARDVGRALGPTLFRRLDPATAGTAGFLIRLVTILLALLVALRIAGLRPETLAVGGAFTAVLIGLAAQQTLGNLIAGIVLLSARPFRVGERVKLQVGALAGTVEGVVSELGLLYTTFSSGDDAMMIPNSVVLSAAIVPLREPDGVNLRARLPAAVTPVEVQDLLRRSVTIPTRYPPRITLEELDGEEVVVRIEATPQHAAEGAQLAGQIQNALAAESRRDWSTTLSHRT